MVDVGIRTGLTVGAERGFEGGGGGGGAESGVAVHVGRAKTRLADHPERVVLL